MDEKDKWFFTFTCFPAASENPNVIYGAVHKGRWARPMEVNIEGKSKEQIIDELTVNFSISLSRVLVDEKMREEISLKESR